MATKINVNGKIVSRPGVYAITKSGIQNPPLNLSYGNVVIIDDGIGASWGGGAGVSGELTQGVDSVYEFDTIQSFRAFVKGGPFWDLADPLFRPGGNGINGVSKIFFVQARQSTQATITLAFDAGTLVIKTKDEGLNANGTVTSGNLVTGHGTTLTAGVIDPTKFILSFYHGTYKGADALNGNIPYDNLTAAQSIPQLLIQSPEVANLQQLVDWMNNSEDFKAAYVLSSSTITTPPGVIIAGDLTDLAGYTAATGATETYAAADFTAALNAVKDLDFTFFLCTKYGADATSLNNTAIFDFLVNDSKFERFMFVAGGANKATFNDGAVTGSVGAANYYNSDKVNLVHAQVKKSSRTGFLIKSQLWHAAAVLGRTCGLEPQVPITFKNLAVDGLVHKLEDAEQELALAEGVIVTKYDFELGYHVILQGVNTLQNNDFLVNEDGTSHDIAVKRITAQLNKEIVVNAKRVFFGKPDTGPNRNTITEADIEAWLEGFLQSRIASSIDDNLIIRFGNITATVEQDTYRVSYEFVPNYPVNKIVFTGVILEN